MVIPAEIREQIAGHAREEAPNEACGLLFWTVTSPSSYVRGHEHRRLALPVRAVPRPGACGSSTSENGLELAVLHSHPSSPPRPSRTDVENIGLWQGKPYVIYSVREDSLSAWTIADGSIQALELE